MGERTGKSQQGEIYLFRQTRKTKKNQPGQSARRDKKPGTRMGQQAKANADRLALEPHNQTTNTNPKETKKQTQKTGAGLICG